jgi:hypothetical protein
MKGSRRSALCAVPAAFLLLAACTGKPPEIQRVVSQLMVTADPDSGATGERMSVFLVANDPDGFDDIASLYLIQDEAEVFWKLEPSGWTKTIQEKETWIGSNGILMPDGSPMPRGEYRALLQDKGGDTVESSFNLSAPTIDAARIEFPKAAAVDGSLSFSGLKESSELWVYDTADRFVTAVPLEKDPVAVAPIVQQNPGLREGFRYRVYTWDKEKGVGLLAGPYTRGSLKAP